MKIVNKHITEEDGGHVTLIIQDSEDLWHAYNLILPGDTISTKTTRCASLYYPSHHKFHGLELIRGEIGENG